MVFDGTASCACAASASPAALLGDTGSCAVSAGCPIPVTRWGCKSIPMKFPNVLPIQARVSVVYLSWKKNSSTGLHWRDKTWLRLWGNYCRSCSDLESKPMKAWIGPQFRTISYNIKHNFSSCMVWSQDYPFKKKHGIYNIVIGNKQPGSCTYLRGFPRDVSSLRPMLGTLALSECWSTTIIALHIWANTSVQTQRNKV